MKINSNWRCRARKRGSIIVMTALTMVVLLGCGAISVDYGLLIADKNRLQRASDAAALAGVSQLKLTGNDATDTYNARALAVAVAAQNGVTLNPNDITFHGNNQQLTVPAVTTRSFFFGKAIGIPNKQVRAAAIAGVSAGDNLSTTSPANRTVPIGITWESYVEYKDTRIPQDFILRRQNKETFNLNDFVVFDLRGPNGKSGAHMQRQLDGSDTEYVTIGDYETTLNASLSSEGKKVTDGVESLLGQANQPPYNDGGNSNNNGNGSAYYQSILAGTGSRSNPRVVQIIVTHSTLHPSGGTYNTEVLAFVPVYIEEIYETDTGDKNKDEDLVLRVRFLPPAVAGEGEATPNPNGNLAGIRVLSLIG